MKTHGSVAIVVLVGMLGTSLPARAASHSRIILTHHADRTTAPDSETFGRQAPVNAPAEVPSRTIKQRGGGSFAGSPRPTLKAWLWIIGATAAGVLVLRAIIPST
jgi:hypothetical protein